MDNDDLEKFWSKVNKTNTCWLWTGFDNGNGYGKVYLKGNPNVSTHRLSYKLHHEEIPTGYQIHHTCGVRLCVNPDHLEAHSRQDHMLLHPNHPFASDDGDEVCNMVVVLLKEIERATIG